LTSLFIVNLVALAYRAAAIIDAWAIAQALGSAPASSRATSLRVSTILSIAGLAAVLLVMSVVHVAVARYDVMVSGALSCVFGGSGDSCTRPGDSGAPAASGQTPEPSDSIGPAASEPSAQPWNGKDRLNILLIGADEQDGAHN